MEGTTNTTMVANVTEAIIQNITEVIIGGNATELPVFANLTSGSESVVVGPTGNDILVPGTDENYFVSGIYQSFILVFLAEIGDKTFIMVMLLSNKMNKFVLWFLATIAMNIMNAISVTIGAIFPLFMPKTVISIVVIVLFFVFGLKMFYNALCAKDDDGEDEMEEAKETLERLDALNDKREPLLPEG